MTLWEIVILAAVLVMLAIVSAAFVLLWRFTTGRSPQLYRFIRNILFEAGFSEFPYDDRYRARFRRDPDDERLLYIIRNAESESRVTLTYGARQMLIIPSTK